MTIKPEHRAHIKQAILALPIEEIRAHKEKLKTDPRVKDLNMRLRWDALYATSLSSWLSANVYPYANEDHIDTVLRQIFDELPLDQTNLT